MMDFYSDFQIISYGLVFPNLDKHGQEHALVSGLLFRDERVGRGG